MTDYVIWPATSGPGAATVDGGVVLATEFYVTTTGLYAKGLRFWRADTSIVGTITGRIYQVVDASTGTAVTGTDVTFTLSGTGWQTATFASPVALTNGQRYRASIQFPTNYSATANYWSSGGGSADIVNGPLTAPNSANATGGDQGSYIVSATLAYTVNQFNSTSYWVDVTVTNVVGPTGTGRSVLAGQSVAVGKKVAGKTTQTAGCGQSRVVGTKKAVRDAASQGAIAEIPQGRAVRTGVGRQQAAGQSVGAGRRSGTGVARTMGCVVSRATGSTATPPRSLAVTGAVLMTGRYAGFVQRRWGGRSVRNTG